MRPAKAVKLGEEFLKGISEGELVSMQVMEKDYTVIPDVPDLAPVRVYVTSIMPTKSSIWHGPNPVFCRTRHHLCLNLHEMAKNI